ncbi:Alpha/Beta hydrolase fold [Sesbania bispinosa]|nr:Alpha/Beta hydrolase fold [Sesbania bispinosa]
MDASSTDIEIAFNISPIMKVYKNSHVERLAGEEVVPPSLDPKTNVESKDVVISKEDGISARLFIPKTNYPSSQKLPLFVYFHGAPEHLVPIAHEDSWRARKWVASHAGGNGPDEWLNLHVDFGKVFFSGDNAGANISHYLDIRVGTEGLPGVKLEGIALVHPYFWGVDRIGFEGERAKHSAKVNDLWRFSCPTMMGSDDPLINPAKDPNLGCRLWLESRWRAVDGNAGAWGGNDNDLLLETWMEEMWQRRQELADGTQHQR